MNKSNKILTMQKPIYYSIETEESYINWIKRFAMFKKEKL